jgi:hypothetical protein
MINEEPRRALRMKNLPAVLGINYHIIRVPSLRGDIITSSCWNDFPLVPPRRNGPVLEPAAHSLDSAENQSSSQSQKRCRVNTESHGVRGNKSSSDADGSLLRERRAGKGSCVI